MKTAERAWFIAGPLLCTAIPLIALPWAVRAGLSPTGSKRQLFIIYQFYTAAGFAVIAALIGIVFILLGRARRPAALTLICATGLLVGIFTADSMTNRVRRKAFEDLAERSKPLIAAVRAHEAKHGRPPESLEGLVPEFLAVSPKTGIGAYPNYHFIPAAAADYDGNPWVILVRTTTGLSFDKFMYFPLTNYPHQGYGGVLERIGDWAYVHE